MVLTVTNIDAPVGKGKERWDGAVCRGQDILRTGRTGKRDGGYSSRPVRYANEWKGPEHGYGVVLGMILSNMEWDAEAMRFLVRVRELLGVASCML